jgi:hypothetical protein
MNVQDRIKRAHISIMQHKKFCAYSGVLACGKVTVGDDVPTAATDGWNVIYNPKFIEEHMPHDPELRFLVLHEATHKAYRHMVTWRALHDENPRLANIAADYFVNLTLHDTDDGEGFIKMPKIGVPVEPKYRGWSVAMIYADLKQQQEEGGGDGEGGGDSGGEGMDEHDWNGNEAALEAALRDICTTMDKKPGQLFGAIRVAVAARNVAPPLFEMLVALGRDVSLARIARAIALFA